MRFKEFKPLNELLSFTSSPFTISPVTGRRGLEVRDMQQALEALGFSVGPPGLDGIIGPYTENAIKQFQTSAGIDPSGKPDNNTIDALNKILKDKPDVIKKLKHSTENDVGPISSRGINGAALKDPDFKPTLDKVASNLGVKSNDLLAIMKLESGLNHQAVNKSSGATGLIQFMPKTARGLGTTTNELFNMTASEQLQYVEKYFKSVGIKSGMDVGDLYVAVFMPAALGKNDSHVLGSSGASGFPGQVYRQNSGLDKNGDGVITVADIKNAVSHFV